MRVEEIPSSVRCTGFDDISHVCRGQTILPFPELRSQRELDIAASRSGMFSRVRISLQRFPGAGLVSLTRNLRFGSL